MAGEGARLRRDRAEWPRWAGDEAKAGGPRCTRVEAKATRIQIGPDVHRRTRLLSSSHATLTLGNLLTRQRV